MSDEWMNIVVDAQSLQRRCAKDDVVSGESPPKLSVVVGDNLRRLRKREGYSLDALAQISGVSRAMLGQIECGKSAPTINLLGRIAQALHVSVASLLSTTETPVTQIVLKGQNPLKSSGAGRFVARALFPLGAQVSAEVYEVSIAGKHQESLPPSARGTKMNVTVISGRLDVRVGDADTISLCEGDSILFPGDIEHSFANKNPDATLFFLVVS